MKKKWAEGAYLALFFAILLVGVATIPLIRQDGTAEKRILAKAPSIRDEEGRLNLADFSAQFEDWLDDHIGLRAFWTQQYARLHAAMGSSVSDQVILGEDGWLYYEPTIADYTGVNALDENARWRVKYTLEALDRALEPELVVFFAPNKNTVAPEYMPKTYPVTDQPHALHWLIENANVEIIDSVSALSGEGLYYRTDTHWNAKGARIGAKEIIARINALLNAQGAAMDPEAKYELGDYTGDLGQMLFPADPPEDVQIVFEDRRQNFQYVGRYRTPEDMTIVTSGEGAPLKVLTLRDSFSNLLIEPLSNAYSDVEYRRAMPLPLMDANEFDVVVLEMVERRIGELLQEAPKVLAARAQPWPESAPNCEAEVCARREKDGVLLYGCLSQSVSRLDALTVCVFSGGESAYYEAFPACCGDFFGDGCFSMYLPDLAQDASAQVFMSGDQTLVSERADIQWVE